MKRATVHLELVTPCFLSGSDPMKPEWRAASIRGQLRWWFRAVAGAELRGDLAKTKAAEAAVFGSTGQRSKVRVTTGGRPPVWTPNDNVTLGRRLDAEKLTTASGLRPTHPLYKETLARLRIGGQGAEVPSNPVQYLGYGCVGLHGLDRACLQPGGAVSFSLTWHQTGPLALSDQERSLLAKAVWSWLALGGIGSKSRNGFGSLQWRETDGDLSPANGETLAPPTTRSAFEEEAERLLAAVRTTKTDSLDWTQLSPASRIFLARDPVSSWEDALVRAGAWIIAFRRRYGTPKDRRTLEGERAIADRDYIWAAPSAGATRRQGFPDRAGFGLPLPFGDGGETVIWSGAGNNTNGGGGDRRRASPLLIHVAHFDKGWVPVLTYLPARFLPAGAQVRFKGHRTPATDPTSEQQGIVTDFLEDLRSRGVIREVTP